MVRIDDSPERPKKYKVGKYLGNTLAHEHLEDMCENCDGEKDMCTGDANTCPYLDNEEGWGER
jgi:hypothetical protein